MADTTSFVFHVADTDDGKVLVCSETEPAFCYICASENEAIQLAQETFKEYVTRFKQLRVHEVTVRTPTRVRERRVVNSRPFAAQIEPAAVA